MLCRAFAIFLGASVALASPSTSGAVPDASADKVIPRGRCGTFISDTDRLVAENHFKANKVSATSQRESADDVTINVYFHVISQDGTREGGDLTTRAIRGQIVVLNQDFRGSGLQFKLASIDRTVNRDWFENVNDNTQQQTDMKNALRKGGAADLNLYSVGFASTSASDDDGDLGYATFPWDYKDNKRNDGVVFLYTTVPGGGKEDYQLGKTVTHEVGHWVGLYHTFQGGCVGDGDMVDDTPAERVPSTGCPRGRNTCLNRPGVDPIHNYMDYSIDTCMTELTQGQILRLRDQLATYRGITF